MSYILIERIVKNFMRLSNVHVMCKNVENRFLTKAFKFKFLDRCGHSLFYGCLQFIIVNMVRPVHSANPGRPRHCGWQRQLIARPLLTRHHGTNIGYFSTSFGTDQPGYLHKEECSSYESPL